LKSIFITGSSGFVGTYLKKSYHKKYNFTEFNRSQSSIEILEDTVVHLAGKAHDLRKVSSEIDYYQINTELTKTIFNAFLKSTANVFIMLSSVKATADQIDSILTEDHISNPITHYGKSKLLAEQYILSKSISDDKRVYILRPCMIHGPGNKGNLNLLFNIVSKGFPWPLGAFENKRSFCSIDNLCFIINELINNKQIPSGIYNVADDKPLATNYLIKLIAQSQEKKFRIWNIPQYIIKLISKMGDVLKLPLNTERLNKLTETYIVSNKKIITAINKQLPLSAEDGLIKTFNSFNIHDK
jgi:nucleoside-diphosphate-sugar epimerase